MSRNHQKIDVLVIGSGFGGCLSAHVLSRLGYRVVVVDRAQHPRFAIGESSTPLADKTLAGLAERYDLPWLKPLKSYGRAKLAYPKLPLGIKRGFSYFRHQPGEPFRPCRNGEHELLVTASGNDYDSDTHWLRADVDLMFAQQLSGSGVELWEGCHRMRLERTTGTYPWSFSGLSHSELFCAARFVIDASGRSGMVATGLDIGVRDDVFETNSRAIYAHVTGLKKWPSMYVEAGGDLQDHPFPCELAAVHHITDEGWMWQLGFDQGTTSVGWLLDQRTQATAERHAVSRAVPLQLTAQQEWQHWLSRYPSLAQQFVDARIIAPEAGYVRTGRLQFLRDQIAGRDWLALPATAGFVDPLHSTGIAHTLHAIRAIGLMFEHAGMQKLPHAKWLGRYAARVRHDLLWIDQLVVACYETRSAWDWFVASTMLYFAAATWCEHARAEHEDFDQPFLASESGLRKVVHSWRQEIRTQTADWARTGESEIHMAGTQSERANAVAKLREWLKPFDQVGLLDPAAKNRYAHTAAPPHDSTAVRLPPAQ